MTKTALPTLEYLGVFLHRFRISSPWWAVLLLLAGLAAPVSAQGRQTSATLKNAVILMGANSANDALSMPVQSGPLDLDLYLQVDKSLNKQLQGKLIVTKFLAQTSPADVVTTSIRIVGTNNSPGDDVPLHVTLTPPDLLHVKLTGSALRSGTTYKGSLFLASGDQSNRWEITLTTGARGIIAVDPVGTMKFTTFPLSASIPYLASNIENCEPRTGSFSFTIRDKSESGPYHHVRVRFEATGTPASKATTSNFSLDTFSFWETKDGKPQRIDLEQREANAPAKVKATESQGINLGYRGQRTLTARIKPLIPGEYAGALRFAADESSEDAQDAKLPLIVQVRHHWVLPLVVILFGSLVGWFSSKYIVGVRKARELARQVKELRARADDLAHPDPPDIGWEFPCEATSYGLARVLVLLSQLAKVASSVIPILVREEDIQQRRRDAELRLTALECLHDMRLRVQTVANGRPAAQLALGRLLRRANDLIERPTYAQTQQTDLTNLLQIAGAWLAPETLIEKYREALADRMISQEIPTLDDVQSFHDGELVRQQLMALRHSCPSKDEITKEDNLDKLRGYDQKIAKMALLWRERETPWAASIAEVSERKVSLDELFRLVDRKLWETLDAAKTAGQLKIERDSTSPDHLLTYDLVEFHLTSNIPDVNISRIRKHPLHVCWSIVPLTGVVRSTESHDLTLVQYFPQPGKVDIDAFLRWQGREIPLNDHKLLYVLPNPEYRMRRILSGGITEWAVIAIAAGFAAATAMSTQYDSTFGSYSQYLSLFLWAAGAGTGGNIFKQLGTTSTPGGQPDVTHQTAAAGGIATAVNKSKT